MDGLTLRLSLAPIISPNSDFSKPGIDKSYRENVRALTVYIFALQIRDNQGKKPVWKFGTVLQITPTYIF